MVPGYIVDGIGQRVDAQHDQHVEQGREHECDEEVFMEEEIVQVGNVSCAGKSSDFCYTQPKTAGDQ